MGLEFEDNYTDSQYLKIRDQTKNKVEELVAIISQKRERISKLGTITSEDEKIKNQKLNNYTRFKEKMINAWKETIGQDKTAVDDYKEESDYVKKILNE